MFFYFITIFPEIIEKYFEYGVLGRATRDKTINIKTYDLRQWACGKYKQIDDTPYGGGAGMVMMIDPIYRAVSAIKKDIDDDALVVLLSAKGKKWTQAKARNMTRQAKHIIFICGRYEGVDERVLEFADVEISIGDFVLSGGELGALVIADSCARLVGGVLGNSASIQEESHSRSGVLGYPQYTKPAVFKVDGKLMEVPKVLLSGNHREIEKWRKVR